MKNSGLPINVSLEIEFFEKVNPEKMIYSPNGEITCYLNGSQLTPVRALRKVYRDRVSGKKNSKLVSMIPVDCKNLNVNGVLGAVNQYETIYAIDTNMIKHEGDTVHASCFISANVITVKENVRFIPNELIHIMEFRNISSNKPENVAWQYLIENIIKDRESKIGIIVDSDLSNILSYNKRENPIIENFYLPKNIDLIYASTDTGSEIINKMIRFSDKRSKHFFKDLKRKKLKIGNMEIHPGKPYSGFCIYKANYTLQTKNQYITGLKIPEGTKISLYGVK